MDQAKTPAELHVAMIAATEKALAVALLEAARVAQAVGWVQAESAIGSAESRRATELRVRVSALQAALSDVAAKSVGWAVTWEPAGPVVDANAAASAFSGLSLHPDDRVDPPR